MPNFDPTVDFTEAELQIINLAEVTVPALREFMTEFPELELDAAIGGLKMKQANLAAGLEVAGASEDSKLSEETKTTE